jgi:Zn-dependent protease with chaperone function
MVDFFSQQDQARRSTRRLLLLFSLAVMALIVLTNIFLAAFLFSIDVKVAGGYDAYQTMLHSLGTEQQPDYLRWQNFLWSSAIVIAVVACAMAYKWLQLAGGGKTVAESLGGRRILPATQDENERRLLNVVEEMALASGMPVPPVYLLADESGINAFAAGNTPADAVVGVTRGAVESFSREQLQGVIAHEFSHILNGDMRLNIRLIAVLHGIVFIGLVGRFFLDAAGSSSRSYGYYNRRSSKNTSALLALGLGLWLLGWLGQFFGGMIKSAVSRQREFLADASAVQFTRNPQGIADALKMIGGHHSALTHPRRDEMSHLFFGSAMRKIHGWFATHPPLAERITRIDKNWDGQFILPVVSRQADVEPPTAEPSATEAQQQRAATMGAVLAGAAAVQGAAIGTKTAAAKSAQTRSYDAIEENISDPLGAQAIVYALVLHRESVEQLKQLDVLANAAIPGLKTLVLHVSPALIDSAPSEQLTLVERVMPALKTMSAQQYKSFKRTLLLLMRADGQLVLEEWCLFQLLRHYLDAEFIAPNRQRPRYKKPQQLADELNLLLSMLANHGHQQDDQRDKAFYRAANQLGLYTIVRLPPERCELADFSQAVERIALAYPLLKPRLLKAMAAVAMHDDEVQALELAMIRAVAAAIDCPVPEFLLQ